MKKTIKLLSDKTHQAMKYCLDKIKICAKLPSEFIEMGISLTAPAISLQDAGELVERIPSILLVSASR